MNKRLFYSFYFLLFAIVVAIYGAIPFFSLPTLGQSLSSTISYAYSFLNNENISFYSHNFGYPIATVKNFGLTGVLLSLPFLKLGMTSYDAYSSMCFIFIFIAFSLLFHIGRTISGKPWLSLAFSFLWCISPFFINHSDYSILSFGFLFFPIYVFILFQILSFDIKSNLDFVLVFTYAFALFIFSIFTDGYNFLFLFVLFLFFIFYNFLAKRFVLKKDLLLKFTFIFAAFVATILIYKMYTKNINFSASSLNFFRGWSVDLSFLLIPSFGISWLSDLVGISLERTVSDYFGDNSVWMTTYSVPYFLIFGICFLCSRKSKINMNYLFLGNYSYKFYFNFFVGIFLIGLYFSLGPEIKFFSLKPEEYSSMGMQSGLGYFKTGNEIFFSNIPGFNATRATYRWWVLSLASIWFCSLFIARIVDKKYCKFVFLSILAAILLLFPNPFSKINKTVAYRVDAIQMDSDLDDFFNNLNFKNNSLGFILPHSNDFLGIYIAARYNLKLFNASNDKNYAASQRHWPELLKKFNINYKYSCGDLHELFDEHVVDYLILTDLDMIWAAHSWSNNKKFIKPKNLECFDHTKFKIRKNDYFIAIYQ